MLLLKARLALELPPINKALSRAAEGLPHPVRPRHIFEAGGKRLRPLLTILMARLLGCDKKDIYDLAVTMEMLHAATLLHDDVLDNADTRRGKPAAHTIFNATSTILAGDAMLAHANALVAQCGDPRLCLCFSEATSRTAAGEILEIAAQHQVETTAEEYEEIIRGKTAWLIRASCQLGALRAGADDALVEAAAAYGENIGMAFQIVDDALDFAPQSVTGKPSGGDVREGKLTPPLRMYRDSPEWMVTANLLQAMYHVHPIREDIAGTEESIARIDAALLRRCYERFYCPGNMVLSVAGCFEEDAVLELAEKYFPTAKTAANPLTIREPRTVREHYCEQKMPIAAPMFQVGFKAAGGEKENMRHRLLDELLLDLICGETTDLYRRLYEAGEINATFGSEVMAGRDFICAMFDGESRQPQAVYEALCERVTTLQRQGIPPQDFARCRRANYGRTIGLYGRAESIAGLMAAAHFSGMKDIYYPLEILRSTTVEELEQRLQEDYDPTTSALSVIWPQGNP